jgi:hypothetical protein
LKRYRTHIIIVLVVFSSCVKPFNPVIDNVATNYLVIEGQIVSGGETTIKLSRTRSVNDSTGLRLENGAQVAIESESGSIYSFQEQGEGIYQSHGAEVNASGKYRLRVITSGKTYLSDFVEVKETPDIDSLEWIQENDVNIYVSTHDPTNNTRYYRWEYIETYEYHAAYQSFLDFRDGQIVFLEPDEYRDVCYTTNHSSEILLGTTIALQNDVVSLAPVISIPNDNSKISVRYSILVKQYAMSAAGYNYWQIIKQNSQPNGDIFDPQPSQLYGNIHCVENPEEPVLGFISASSVKEKRLFIRWTELKDRTVIDNSILCRETFIDPSDAEKFLRDGGKLPAYSITDGPLAIVNAVCVDCRIRGGVTQKPSFW